MIVAGIVAAVAVIGAAGGAVFARSRRGSRSAPPPPPAPDLGGSLHQLADRVRPSVPPAVVARVTRIATTVDEIEPRLDDMGFANVDAHGVVRTATSYVPEALDAYMRLPRTFADTRKIQGSKTALAILCDQLDLLAAKMDQVRDAVYRRDAQALIQHGQFLQARFATGADLLGPGGAAAASGPGGSAPGVISPGDTAPGDTAPGGTAPGGAAPGTGAPGGGPADGAAPGGPAPSDSDPGGSPPDGGTTP